MRVNAVLENRYHDSAVLMGLARSLARRFGVEPARAAVMMGTPMNKRLLEEAGLLEMTGRAASSSDIIAALGVEGPGAPTPEALLGAVRELLAGLGTRQKGGAEASADLADVLARHPESPLVSISVPGPHAAREARIALDAGRHVFLFSDNVPLSDEVALKMKALSKGLLMMGPDCGSAFIDGVGLGFSNALARGPVGIAAASGSGLQEVACLVSNAGSGVSQAVGVGGRDLQDAVGALMMVRAVDLLEEDPGTRVVVVISKAPGEGALEALCERLELAVKPVVACFPGADRSLYESLPDNVHAAHTLESAVLTALELCCAARPDFRTVPPARGNGEGACLPLGARFIRGVYCGGTFAGETLGMLRAAGFETVDALEAEKPGEWPAGHLILDAGADAFTVGRPHPMIDPESRSASFMKAALEPATAVLLADVVLGYGVADDAAEVLARDVRSVLSARPGLQVVVHVCGALADPQGYGRVVRLLSEAGAWVAPTNARAAGLAIELLGKKEGA